MGADATAEIQHLALHRHALKPQRVRDVVRTGEMPGRQLQQVPGAHLVLIEGGGVLRPERTGVQVRQVVSAAGQTLLELFQRQVEITAEVLLNSQTVRQESGDVHIRAAAELGHGWASGRGQPTQPPECNSQGIPLQLR